MFSWVWNLIRFMCVHSEKETERERWSSWRLLRKTIPSHLNKAHPGRTGEMMGWWHFKLETLSVVKGTELFECWWIRLRLKRSRCLPKEKQDFIGHAVGLRQSLPGDSHRHKEHQPSCCHYQVRTDLIIVRLTLPKVKVNITVTLSDSSFSFISGSFPVLDYQLHVKGAATAGETALVLVSIPQESRRERSRSWTRACF